MWAAGGIFKGLDAAVHKAPKRKRTLAGPFPDFTIAGLLAVAALAARIAGHSADFVVRVPTKGERALVRVARIAALGPIAHALVALEFDVDHGAALWGTGANGGATSQGHGACRRQGRAFPARQGIPLKGSTGYRDVPTRENGSEEGRIRQRRVLGDPPKHVWT